MCVCTYDRGGPAKDVYGLMIRETLDLDGSYWKSGAGRGGGYLKSSEHLKRDVDWQKHITGIVEDDKEW